MYNKVARGKENPHKESLLKSLQFIYQDYLNHLEIGYPSLWNSDDDQQDSYMEVTFNSQNKILAFNSVNMDLLEQTKTMTKFFIMQK